MGGSIHVPLFVGVIAALFRVIRGRKVLQVIPERKGVCEMKILGVALVILGIVGLVYGGIGYQRERTILDLGGIKATATEHRTIPITPVAGAIALIGGIALVAAPRFRRH